MIVYIHLHCINAERQTTTPFDSWLKSSQVSVLFCNTKIYSFKAYVILFDFSSTHFKVFIYLSCIITQRWTTAPFDSTNVLSSSNLRIQRLYQVSANSCEGDCNLDVLCLLQTSLTIHYCNQWVLAISPDLNIFIWSITMFDLILRSTLVQYFSITC